MKAAPSEQDAGLFTLLWLVGCFLLLSNHCYAQDVDPSGQWVSVLAHGADGDDTLDDTQAFISAINQCKSAGGKTLFIPVGTYYLSSELPPLNDVFAFVSVVGENTHRTIIDVTRLASNLCALNSAGGSGKLVNAGISGITIRGNGSQNGIVLKGSCGIHIRNCNFTSLRYGLVYSNDLGTSSFTEFCVAEGCSFLETNTALLYRRGTGNASFHGSGLRNCTISCPQGATDPVIEIGQSSDTQVNLYNAPLDFQVWTRQNVDIIQTNVANNSKLVTYGTITLELFNDSEPTLANSSVPIYHAGNITCWGSPIRFGDMVLVDWAVINPSGTINFQRKPYNVAKTLNTSETALDAIRVSKLGSMVSLSLKAAYYEYNYLLYLGHNGYGSDGYVSILTNTRMVNQAGYGPPSFSVNDGGKLVITNSNYAGTPVDFKAFVFGIGQREPCFIGD